MNSLTLDRCHNRLWFQWEMPLAATSFYYRAAKVALYPIHAMGSLTFSCMIKLRNRVFSKPVFSDAMLKWQFSLLTKDPWFTQTTSALQHKDHNRYSDILPYDHNRVKLHDPNFYFNASSALGGRAIASQGPMASEIDRFWEMVSEKEVSTIVMLTNLNEKSTPKCAKYWEGKFGQYQINTKKEETLVENSGVKIVKRTLEVKKGSETKTITQLHLVNWPDHGVVSPEVLSQFVEIAHREKRGEGPTLAHCSAGVGRTGTFLAVYEAFRLKTSRLFPIVDALRYERCWMVQRPEQYILAQRAIERLISYS